MQTTEEQKQARKESRRKWDKEHMMTVTCRITKTKSQQFKDACRQLGVTPNQVLIQAINETINKVGDQSQG